MKYGTVRYLILFALLAAFVAVLPGFGQYREYNISGKVVDLQKKPIEGVEIVLRDVQTSRSYSLNTKKDGTFRLVGLPHGVYQVTFTKEGYAEKTDEWRFETPQETMQKVEIPTVTMASREIIEEAQRMKEAATEVKAAAEKIRLEDYDGAIADLKPVLDKNPKDSNALYLMGMAYLKKKMYAEATTPLVKVTELSPKFAAAYYQLGICYQGLNDSATALEYYEKAMALDPANPDAPYNAGLILFAESRVDEALARFEQSLALRPDDPAVLEMAGRCYIHRADYAKAVEYLEKAKAGYAADEERVRFLDDLIAKLKEQIKK